MGGYDRREHINGRTQLGYNYPGAGLKPVYPVASKVCSVTSYRSQPTGILVEDRVADPQAYWLTGVSQRKRASVAARHTIGSEQSFVLDNGHAFKLTRHSTETSVRSGVYHVEENYSSPAYGGPITTGGGLISGFAQPRQLFGYEGDYGAYGPKALLPSFDPQYWGPKAISTLSPTRPSVNVSVALAELLREGIPRGLVAELNHGIRNSVKDLRGYKPPATKTPVTMGQLAKDGISVLKQGGILKNASSDYLNYMFGIAPLVRDISALYQTLLKASEIIAQYERDAGNGVRRSMELLSTTDTESFSGLDLDHHGQIGVTRSHWPASFTGGSSSADVAQRRPKTTVTQLKREKIWFSGSFSYYLPLPADFAGRVDHFNSLWARLYGKPVSWEALWELSPWSWLFDWFIDLQSLIASAEIIKDDNLVVNYGYLMRSCRMITQVDSTIQWHPNQKAGVTSVRTTHTSETKQRVRANPFGFSLKTPDSLSGVQWSLLAAIGFSR